MTTAEEWRQRIVQLVLVKQKIAELDANGLWEYRLPAIAASEERLSASESQLGERLDPSYRDFLAAADGWPAFYQSVDLFGTHDLLGERSLHASEMLGYVEDAVFDVGGFTRRELIPIAATTEDLDLFVMTRRSTSNPGMVIWLAGSEVERFETFDDYFLAMLDYNRLTVQRMQSKMN